MHQTNNTNINQYQGGRGGYNDNFSLNSRCGSSSSSVYLNNTNNNYSAANQYQPAYENNTSNINNKHSNNFFDSSCNNNFSGNNNSSNNNNVNQHELDSLRNEMQQMQKYVREIKERMNSAEQRLDMNENKLCAVENSFNHFMTQYQKTIDPQKMVIVKKTIPTLNVEAFKFYLGDFSGLTYLLQSTAQTLKHQWVNQLRFVVQIILPSQIFDYFHLF
jgi:outer membrane murein-binding lipoprotein Lpp